MFRNLIGIVALGLIANTLLPEGLVGTFRVVKELPYIEQTVGFAAMVGIFTMWVIMRIEQQSQPEEDRL